MYPSRSVHTLTNPFYCVLKCSTPPHLQNPTLDVFTSYTLSNPFPSVHTHPNTLPCSNTSQHTSVFKHIPTHLKVLPPFSTHLSIHTSVFTHFPIHLCVHNLSNSPYSVCIHIVPKHFTVSIQFQTHLTVLLPFPTHLTVFIPFPNISQYLYSSQHISVFTPSLQSQCSHPSQQTSVFTPFSIDLGVRNRSNSPYCVCFHLVPKHPTVFIPFPIHLTVFIPFPTHLTVFILFPNTPQVS